MRYLVLLMFQQRGLLIGQAAQLREAMHIIMHVKSAALIDRLAVIE